MKKKVLKTKTYKQFSVYEIKFHLVRK